MIVGSRQSFWKSSFNTIWPYLDFNVNGASRKSRYFNTNVKPTVNTSIEWCFGLVSSPALNTGWQSGVRTGWISKALMFNFVPNGSNGIWYMWNSSDADEYAGTTWQLTDKFATLKQEATGKIYVNDVLVHDFAQTLSPANYPIFIGDVNENGSAKGRIDSQGSGRLFWVKIYENNSLIHHYVPELYNNQAGLYDEVTNEHLQSTTSTSLDASSIQYGELDIRERERVIELLSLIHKQNDSSCSWREAV